MTIFFDVNAKGKKTNLLRKMLESRILGTGIHLTHPKPYKYCIGYSQIPVWGIKKALEELISDLYFLIYDSINVDSNESILRQLIRSLRKVAKIYHVAQEILEQKIVEVKIPKINWNYMDSDMKMAVVIGAFFDAFDETRIQSLNRAEKSEELILILQRNETNAPEIDYRLEDFGFMFRARIYVNALSEIRLNGAYRNLVQRIDQELQALYKEYFIDQKRKMSHKQGMPTRGNLPSQDRTKHQEILELLESNEKTGILKAFDMIERRKLKKFAGKLEYYFNHENEEIMDRAFTLYMKLTN